MKIIFTVISALFLCASSFGAINYYDIDPDGTTTVDVNPGSWSGIGIDLNDDWNYDYTFYWSDNGTNWEIGMSIESASAPPNLGFQILAQSASPNFIQALDAGSQIDGNLSIWNDFATNSSLVLSSSTNENIIGLGEKYIALRFGVPGAWKYAWLRFEFDSSRTLTVMDYAFENTEETPIIAGSSSVLVQSINVTGTGGSSTISSYQGTLQMLAEVLPANANDPSYTWSVDDPNIATIDATGLLTAVSNGVVTVTATANDLSQTTGSMDVTISGQDAGIVTNDRSQFIRLYPNPAVNELYLMNHSGYVIKSATILSLNGAELTTNSGIATSIDLNAIQTGSYFIRIELENGATVTQRFNKQ